MSDPLDDLKFQAECGDLRPQFNPRSVALSHFLATHRKEIEPILVDRFFQLSRPIADSSKGERPENCLGDIGAFFSLLDALKRIPFEGLPDLLRVLLDGFCALEANAYDELYLWCITQLSRTNLEFVKLYWPLALQLDAIHRAEPWTRPHGEKPFAQPYAFSELLFYYYALHPFQVRQRRPRNYLDDVLTVSLGECMQQLAPSLSPAQAAIAKRSLEMLRRYGNRPGFSDALGMFNRHAPREPQ